MVGDDEGGPRLDDGSVLVGSDVAALDAVVALESAAGDETVETEESLPQEINVATSASGTASCSTVVEREDPTSPVSRRRVASRGRACLFDAHRRRTFNR